MPTTMEDWEVTGEEEENRIDKKRNGLGKDTARYTKNFAIVKSLSLLEVDRLFVHKECTEECEAEIISNLYDVVDTLVKIYDLNQSIVEQVHEKGGKTNARIIRGGGVASSMLNRVEATLGSSEESSEVLIGSGPASAEGGQGRTCSELFGQVHRQGIACLSQHAAIYPTFHFLHPQPCLGIPCIL